MTLLVTMMVLHLSDPFLGFHESIQIHIFKYQTSHPQNTSELEFENSAIASWDSDQNRQTYQKDLIDVLSIVLDIYMHSFCAMYGMEFEPFTDQWVVLGYSKTVGLIF